ncbi:MAG: diphthamide biosynthesis enzyme Dph2 [Candidatus Thermoplasmatota archaeon]
MNISKYHIDLESLINTIKKNKYRVIGVQVPEGLKHSADKIIDYIENNTNCRCILLADPCYGACDIPSRNIRDIGINCLVHVGHLGINSLKNHSDIHLFFIDAHYTGDVKKVVKKALSLLEGKHIGVLTTAQHIKNLDTAKEILLRNGLEPVVSDSGSRVKEPGCILGCDLSAALNIKDRIDSYLFIGSGFFHPVGLSLCTDKIIVAADPYTNTINKDEIIRIRDRILKQRYNAILKAKDAKTFAIIIGLKPGQQRIKLANKIKDILHSKNKRSYTLALDVFTPNSLLAFTSIDCFISTACPRIAIDDYHAYKKPMITPVELEIALGLRSWDDYCFDQITEC